MNQITHRLLLFVIVFCCIMVARPPHVQAQSYATPISAGANHTCKITRDRGLVYCWGANNYGQLGDGSTINRMRPVPVYYRSGSTLQHLRASAISAGLTHTCAINKDVRGIWCWGANNYGQLGNGSVSEFETRPVRVVANPKDRTNALITLRDETKITAGAHHSCAFANIIGQSATTWCWGLNDKGQLGTGTSTKPNGAYMVKRSNGQLLSNISHMDIGFSHTCAVLSREVLCWGFDHWDTTYGKSVRNTATPIKKFDGTLLNDIASVSAGYEHTCAHSRAKDVWCWGENSGGQLGDTTYNPSYARAIQVKVADGTPLKNVIQIDAGYYHNCAAILINTTSSVACWGINQFYQLGISTSWYVPYANTPPRFVSARNVTAGGNHSCSWINTSTFCWGYNLQGQLGNGNLVTTYIPAQVRYTSGAAFY